MTDDPVVDRVIDTFIRRSSEGMKTYDMSMADNPASRMAWLIHLQEELMDACLYLERLKEELND